MFPHLLDAWHEAFGPDAPACIVRAPGRVNIIGEHTDYNEGWVLPGAMSRCIYLLVSKSQTGHTHWIAHDLRESLVTTEDILEYGQYAWARYLEGAIRLYAPDIGPLQLLVGGDLPVGAGISSSSALVCGFLFALQQLKGGQETREEIALLGSRVEREVIGLQGGIMDQFAIMLCEPDRVIELDCRTRKYHQTKASLPGCQWILINTKVKHQLIDSDYNQRADQCAQVVTLLKKQNKDINTLRDVSPEMLIAAGLPETLRKRALFVLAENERVHQMVKALEAKDAVRAGDLLKASHHGLRFEYEVSCGELDYLADFANQYEGVMGARMMGGGFGGCVICLVKESVLESFTENATDAYRIAFGFDPEVIRFTLGKGVDLVTD